MPRVNLTSAQRRDARLRDGNAALGVAMAVAKEKTGQTQRALADRLGITEARLSCLKRAPGGMRLDMFRDLVHETGMSDEAIVAVVRGRRLL